MKFADWLDEEPGRTIAVAAHFGVTPSAVSQWRSGVPLHRIKAVRDLTGGAVSIEDMVPDTSDEAKAA